MVGYFFFFHILDFQLIVISYCEICVMVCVFGDFLMRFLTVFQLSDGIRPFTMPLMKLACTALERVPLTRHKVIEHLMRKFNQDLVFCRAPEDNAFTTGVYGMLFLDVFGQVSEVASLLNCRYVYEVLINLRSESICFREVHFGLCVFMFRLPFYQYDDLNSWFHLVLILMLLMNLVFP